MKKRRHIGYCLRFNPLYPHYPQLAVDNLCKPVIHS